MKHIITIHIIVLLVVGSLWGTAVSFPFQMRAQPNPSPTILMSLIDGTVVQADFRGAVIESTGDPLKPILIQMMPTRKVIKNYVSEGNAPLLTYHLTERPTPVGSASVDVYRNGQLLDNPTQYTTDMFMANGIDIIFGQGFQGQVGDIYQFIYF